MFFSRNTHTRGSARCRGRACGHTLPQSTFNSCFRREAGDPGANEASVKAAQPSPAPSRGLNGGAFTALEGEFESCQHTAEEADPSSASGSGSKFGCGGMGCTHSKVSNTDKPPGSEAGGGRDGTLRRSGPNAPRTRTERFARKHASVQVLRRRLARRLLTQFGRNRNRSRRVKLANICFSSPSLLFSSHVAASRRRINAPGKFRTPQREAPPQACA